MLRRAIGLHMVAYLMVVFILLPPGKALAFVAIHQALFGLYLGCSFAPNHKGMAVLAADDHTDFLRRQVLTSRNVRGNWLVDYALGGLNYQIEHHLFPSMPRPHLAQAREIVRDYCKTLDVPYAETTLFKSYGIVIRYLNEVGLSAADPFECGIVQKFRTKGV